MRLIKDIASFRLRVMNDIPCECTGGTVARENTLRRETEMLNSEAGFLLIKAREHAQPSPIFCVVGWK